MVSIAGIFQKFFFPSVECIVSNYTASKQMFQDFVYFKGRDRHTVHVGIACILFNHIRAYSSSGWTGTKPGARNTILTLERDGDTAGPLTGS